jgi:hypothetical protein
VGDELPLLPDPRVDLAGASLPVRVPVPRVSPESVDVDYGKRAVPLCRELDADDCAPVVDERVGVEQLLPAPAPASSVKAAERQDPEGRVVI